MNEIKYAMIFPGQGSQSLRMMDGLLTEKIVLDAFYSASDILHIDFLAMLQEQSADNINKTIYTQALMLTADYATYLLWQKYCASIEIEVIAGHSLGEWVALLAANVISFADALQLVSARAQLMQAAANGGVMAAILGCDENIIKAVCSEVSGRLNLVVEISNFNSPQQCIIAGDHIAVREAMDILNRSGAKKTQLLAVSVPAHCSLMKNASIELSQKFDTIKWSLPTIPIIHNCHTEIYQTSLEGIKKSLLKQLYMPVLWDATITKMVTMGVNHIIECGPGSVLSVLNKRIDKSIISYNLHNLADFEMFYC